MNKIWCHLKKCASYEYFPVKPIPDTQLRDVALIIINQLRVYQQAYLILKQQANQTFNNVKMLFNRAEANKNYMMEDSVGHGYGKNAEQYDPLNNNVATRACKESL